MHIKFLFKHIIKFSMYWLCLFIHHMLLSRNFIKWFSPAAGRILVTWSKLRIFEMVQKNMLRIWNHLEIFYNEKNPYLIFFYPILWGVQKVNKLVELITASKMKHLDGLILIRSIANRSLTTDFYWESSFIWQWIWFGKKT